MFNDFFTNGNVLSVILMVYAGNVMMEALRRDRMDRYGVSLPPIIRNPLSSIFMLASVPCAFLPAIYIGYYSGFLSGVVAWIVLQITGAVITILLGIRGPLLGFHFIIACIAFPIGYFLSISDMLY